MMMVYSWLVKCTLRDGYDPLDDVAPSPEGVWAWATDKPGLHQAIKDYFDGRKEDAEAGEMDEYLRDMYHVTRHKKDGVSEAFAAKLEREEWEAATGLKRDWDEYKTRGRPTWIDGRGPGEDGDEGVLGLELKSLDP